MKKFLFDIKKFQVIQIQWAVSKKIKLGNKIILTIEKKKIKKYIK